jgi:4-carboxymuconolactone decarboxylase
MVDASNLTELPLRVTIPAKADVDEETAKLLDFVYRPHLGVPIPTVGVLALTPTMFAPFLQWASALALEGILPKRDQELLALRTAWHCHSKFEWVEHAEFARNDGMTDDEIDAIVAGPDAGWVDHEAALLRAADELHDDCEISPTTWDALAAHYSPGELVEIPFVVGQYTMLSMVANGLGTV